MSYRTIVTVINEHTTSTLTARYAISLATACNAELVLYAAHDDGSNETIRNQTNRHLDHVFSVASDLHLQTRRIHEDGNLTKLLPQRVQEEKADLVFYSLAPDERYGTTLQQNTVHHLLRTVGCDLAIMRTITMAKPHPRHILLPLGRVVNDKSRRLQFITELAKSFNSQVTLFHLFTEHEAKNLPADISEFQQQLAQQEIIVNVHNGSGSLSKAITVEAINRHHDLIVLGASGRGLLRRLFYGNLASDLLYHPPCNTILFRASI